MLLTLKNIILNYLRRDTTKEFPALDRMLSCRSVMANVVRWATHTEFHVPFDAMKIKSIEEIRICKETCRLIVKVNEIRPPAPVSQVTMETAKEAVVFDPERIY